MTTYNDLVTYFEALPDTVAALKGVTVGNDEAILDLQNSRIQYPHLWVETPEVVFTGLGDANPVKRFRFALAVIENDPAKTNAQANAKLSATLAVLEQVYARIIADAEDPGDFTLVYKDEALDPIRRWSGDNGYGWRGTIEIELSRCECDDCGA